LRNKNYSIYYKNYSKNRICFSPKAPNALPVLRMVETIHRMLTNVQAVLSAGKYAGWFSFGKVFPDK